MCILQLTLEEDLKIVSHNFLLYSLYHKSNKQIKKCKHFSSKFAIILLKTTVSFETIVFLKNPYFTCFANSSWAFLLDSSFLSAIFLWLFHIRLL